MYYVPRLDTFRAIAALAVVWTHFFNPMLPQWAAHIYLGGTGVTFFFVLSGYLITQVLLADDDGDWRGRLRRFYIRRSFRIFPVYYFVLLAGLLLGIEGFAESMPWSALYLTNFCPVLCADLGAIVYTGHLWTLAVEEQFYLVWPLLVVFLPRRWLFPATALIVVAILAYVFVAFGWIPAVQMHRQLLDWSLILHAPALLTGALVAIGAANIGIARVERALRYMLPLTAPTMLLVSHDMAAAVAEWHLLFAWPIRPLGQVLFMAWLIAKAVSDGPLASSWGGRLLPALGTISYGIYLYHLPIRSFMDIYDPFNTSIAARLVAIVVVLVVATGSYVFLEKPLRRLGRRIAASSDRSVQGYPAAAR